MNIEIKSPRMPRYLTISALLIIAGIIALGFKAYKDTEKSTFQQFNRRQLVIARSVAHRLSTCFQHISGEMFTLRRMLSIKDPENPSVNAIINHVFKELKAWGVNDISILDRDGKLIFSMTAPHIIGMDFSWRDYFKKTKLLEEGEERFITEFIQFKGVEAGRNGLLTALPLYRKSQFNGTVVITQHMDFLTGKFVSGVRSDSRGHSFVIDEKFNVLWSPDPAMYGKSLYVEAKGFPEFQKIVSLFVSGDSGFGEYRFRRFNESEGRFTDISETILVAYESVRIGDKLWVSAIWAPKASARKQIRSLFINLIIVALLCIFVIGSAYFYVLTLSRRTSRKLEKTVREQAGQLENSHNRMLTILNSLGAAVYTADMESGEILFANQYLKNIYGDVEGKICFQVFQEGQSKPCEYCTNPQLIRQGEEDINTRTFETTASGLWHEHRERAVRWVDGRLVRLEIAMNVPCEPRG